MHICYDATDQELLDAGLPARLLQLSKQAFIRPGAVDLDVRYALSVWDAKDQRDLYALMINNPGAAVHFPPSNPYMGYVP